MQNIAIKNFILFRQKIASWIIVSVTISFDRKIKISTKSIVIIILKYKSAISICLRELNFLFCINSEISLSIKLLISLLSRIVLINLYSRYYKASYCSLINTSATEADQLLFQYWYRIKLIAISYSKTLNNLRKQTLQTCQIFSNRNTYLFVSSITTTIRRNYSVSSQLSVLITIKLTRTRILILSLLTIRTISIFRSLNQKSIALIDLSKIPVINITISINQRII